MAFELDKFARRSKHFCHSTSIENLSNIRGCGRLLAASEIMGSVSGQHDLKSQRVGRQHCGPVILQSQRPLIKRNIDWNGGQKDWDLAAFVELLNSLVSLWPGKNDGPIERARSHLKSADGPGNAAILRIPSEDVMRNVQNEPLFCAYNSGMGGPEKIDAFMPGGHIERDA